MPRFAMPRAWLSSPAPALLLAVSCAAAGAAGGGGGGHLGGLGAAAALTSAVASSGAAAARAGAGAGAGAAAFFVSAAGGDDEAAGTTSSAPFQTLGRCATAMRAAGAAASCEVAAGTYREAVALPTSWAHPLSFRATAGGSRPVLSGLDTLPNLTWTKKASSSNAEADSCVFVAELPAGTPSFQQLFYKNQAMIEARWPNVNLETFDTDILDKSKAWQPTSKGSRACCRTRRNSMTPTTS